MIYFGREMMIEWIEYVKDMNFDLKKQCKTTI